jgi:hypothetical protein
MGEAKQTDCVPGGARALLLAAVRHRARSRWMDGSRCSASISIRRLSSADATRPIPLAAHSAASDARDYVSNTAVAGNGAGRESRRELNGRRAAGSHARRAHVTSAPDVRIYSVTVGADSAACFLHEVEVDDPFISYVHSLRAVGRVEGTPPRALRTASPAQCQMVPERRPHWHHSRQVVVPSNNAAPMKQMSRLGPQSPARTTGVDRTNDIRPSRAADLPNRVIFHSGAGGCSASDGCSK